MKNIMKFFLEPIRFLGSRGVSDRIVKFFDRHPWLIYIVALFISLGAIFMMYIAPVLGL